jgi:translation initiation factor IF-3
VIDENGEQAGIMLLEVAQQMARNRSLDLVLISPNASPPVARIMDYGKYRYEQQKREKEAKKKQKIIQVKEVRLTPSIEAHDIEVKAKNTKKFLQEGDKVKVSMRFRGRERGRTERGVELMETFAERIKAYGSAEKRPAFEGRNLVMIIAPLTEKERKQYEKVEERRLADAAADAAEAAEGAVGAPEEVPVAPSAPDASDAPDTPVAPDAPDSPAEPDTADAADDGAEGR